MSIFDEVEQEKSGNIFLDFFATNIGRLLFSMIIPVLTFLVLWFGFTWLRGNEAPRWLLAPVAIVWGVGGVLMLYGSANYVTEQFNTYWKNAISPFIFVGPAMAILTWFLLGPTIVSFGISMYDDNDAVMKYHHYKEFVDRVPQELIDAKDISKKTVNAYLKDQYAEQPPWVVKIDLNTNQMILRQELLDHEYKIVQKMLAEFDFIKDGEKPPKYLDESNKRLNLDYESKMKKHQANPDRYKKPAKNKRVGKKDFKETILKALSDAKRFEEKKLVEAVYTKKSRFVFLGNYTNAITDESNTFISALGNNLIWVLIGPTLCVLFGLIVSLLADRSSFESIAKALIFLPLAISFVGAGIIFKFIYASRPPLEMQIGVLNALTEFLGGAPVNWLNTQSFKLNTILLVIILIWMQTGYAMVLIASAIKGVPDDLLEAARIDGAGELRIIISVIIPYIRGTIITVWTTITIMSLKVFDIIFIMTGGKMGTDVIATLQYKEAFVYFNNNMGSTYAILMLILVSPVIIYNLRQFAEREVF